MTERDAEFVERELTSFLPRRVFDAHCHLWRSADEVAPLPHTPAVAGLAEYADYMADIHPGRAVAGLFIPFPHPKADTKLASQWVADQIAGRSNCRGLYLVRPDDDPEFVRQEVRRLKLHGLKCYHVYAPGGATLNAEIPAYLPEPLVRVAHEEGWVITLHMVRRTAVADESNIHWIRHYCTKYPGMKLILAHSARGFQPAHNFIGLPRLADLENLYFDSSANCEPLAHETVIRICGHQKLMYGSDFHVSHIRGRSASMADSFVWIYEESALWGEQTHEVVEPVLLGLEHLRSLKWACWSARLSDAQVEDIFWTNAARVFGLRNAGN